MPREVGRLWRAVCSPRRTSFGLTTGIIRSPNRRTRAVGRARVRQVANRDVDVAAAEVDQAVVGGDVDLDVGMRARGTTASRGITHSDANETVVDTREAGRAMPPPRRRRPPIASAPSAAVTSRWNATPAGVSASARCLRANSGTPSASSSACTWRESADCVTNVSCAARVNDKQPPGGLEALEEVERRQPPQGLMHACRLMQGIRK